MIIAIIVFAVAMVIGLPVAFALGLMGTVHIVSLGNPAYYLVVIQRLVDQVNMASLTCLPFFILAGELMNGGGVTKRLLNFLREILGWLKRNFKKTYGMPVHAYLQQRRMETACRLLRSGAQSVGEIAQQVGYDSQSRFSAAFRAYMGESPRDYRNRAGEVDKK